MYLIITDHKAGTVRVEWRQLRSLKKEANIDPNIVTSRPYFEDAEERAKSIAIERNLIFTAGNEL